MVGGTLYHLWYKACSNGHLRRDERRHAYVHACSPVLLLAVTHTTNDAATFCGWVMYTALLLLPSWWFVRELCAWYFRLELLYTRCCCTTWYIRLGHSSTEIQPVYCTSAVPLPLSTSRHHGTRSLGPLVPVPIRLAVLYCTSPAVCDVQYVVPCMIGPFLPSYQVVPYPAHVAGTINGIYQAPLSIRVCQCTLWPSSWVMTDLLVCGSACSANPAVT